jgi:hypothetical protein
MGGAALRNPATAKPLCSESTKGNSDGLQGEAMEQAKSGIVHTQQNQKPDLLYIMFDAYIKTACFIASTSCRHLLLSCGGRGFVVWFVA